MDTHQHRGVGWVGWVGVGGLGESPYVKEGLLSRAGVAAGETGAGGEWVEGSEFGR